MNETTTPPGQTATAFNLKVGKYSNINVAGFWVDDEGNGYRVFQGGLQTGHSPLNDVPAARNLTLVSLNPGILYAKALTECANRDISLRPMPN
ncbi:MAG: hypothetical protein AAB594_02715 [Patescibacteria group bacterium]